MNIELLQTGVARLPDARVRMRDGVHLATDVYLPADEAGALPGPWPVILERTPYGKRGTQVSERSRSHPQPIDRATVAAYFVRRGFAVVFQDCRGRHGSEGEFVKYIREADDGADTLAWVRQQAWCNGRVGMMGLSYAAHTQMALACLNPPGLACLFMDSGGFWNAHRAGIRQGGAFELKQATWAYRHALQSPEAQRDPLMRAALEAEDIRDWFGRMPWKPGHSPLRAHPDYEAYFFDQWRAMDFDAEWAQIGLCAEGRYHDAADIPTFLMCGWYDPYASTIPANFNGLRQHHRGPHYMVMGPWTHGARSDTFAGDVDFGPTATLDGQLADDYLALRLAWFRRWLQDDAAAWPDDTPTVRYFRMGGGDGRRDINARISHGGQWCATETWPPTQATPVRLYLAEGGRLLLDAPMDAGERTYTFDPRHPVPSIGGAITSGAPVMEGGAYDQREAPQFFGSRPPYLPTASRPDVLVFETEPLDSSMEISGPVAVTLWVSSDCPDTDFTAKLVDVHPASADWPRGFAMNVCDGILRVRYRNGWDHAEMMEPGVRYPIRIELMPTSNLFDTGHRIRLEISSSKFPHFDVNPNTGGNPVEEQSWRIATNSVHFGGLTPSGLEVFVR
ncbi:CocE/NonD family hydrolase [Uliginosibacterium sp. sgz301328]|uniref:CocE/NonD family hydrolase n=1 Tax=Uliginosibacterium sp. sgz301328 TaxID=3243764 RepID=UPI00359D9D90